MIGKEKTMITPFTRLTTLSDPDTINNLMFVWKTLPICTKLAFVSFIIAKGVLVVGIMCMAMLFPAGAATMGFIYAFTVWFTVFLAVRDWLVYYTGEEQEMSNEA